MAGMKIQCTMIRNLASSKPKGAAYGILLLLLAFVFPRLDMAEETSVGTKSTQQQAVLPQKDISTENLSKKAARNDAAAIPAVGSITDIKVAPEDGQLTVAVTTNKAVVPK